MDTNWKKYWKFGLLITAIVGTLSWLAVGGINQTKTYYKTIPELNAMGDRAKDTNLRVGGDIAPHSISRDGRVVRFTLMQENTKLPVLYDGIDPLPDTFKDGAMALADGRLQSDGTFHAKKIQAKCASKYEQKPTMAKPDSASHSST
jgi:cytochrome c-type biogenesis protein CcmE